MIWIYRIAVRILRCLDWRVSSKGIIGWSSMRLLLAELEVWGNDLILDMRWSLLILGLLGKEGRVLGFEWGLLLLIKIIYENVGIELQFPN